MSAAASRRSRSGSAVAVLAFALCILPGACTQREPEREVQQAAAGAGTGQALQVLKRPGYFAPETIPEFQTRTGIDVRFEELDAEDAIEARLLAGQSGFDVVVVSSHFLARQIRAGLFAKLDKSRLPNLRHIDPDSMRRAARHDPGNEQAVPYLWSTTGIAYDKQRLSAIMADAPVDSWRIVFDPQLAAKFKDCGLYLPDAPEEVVSLALVWLGRDPSDARPEDLAAVERTLAAIRPYVRPSRRSGYLQELAAGNLCLAVARSSDLLLASQRSEGWTAAVTIDYEIPKEGTIVWFDVLAIPADTSHSRNAHAFIDYLLDPQVAANNSNFGRYANANAASLALLDEDLRGDPKIYPAADVRTRLFALPAYGEALTREAARIWPELASK